MTQVTLKTRLPDSNDDKVVKVSAKGAKKYGLPKSGNWYGPLPDAPPFTYSDVDPTKVPAPSPTPSPPPAPTPAPSPTPSTGGTVPMSAIRLGEVFLQTPDITVGLNEYGGIGTAKNAPAGYPTDDGNGFLRVGIFVEGLTDITLPGRSIEGPGWMIDGKRYANMMLAGWKGIAGSFSNPLLWIGTGAGLKTEQRMTIIGRVIRIEMTDTNVSDKPIELQPFRSVDPDQNEKFVTTNKVTAPGVMECTLPGKVGKLIVRAPGASFCYGEYNQCQTIGTPQAVGITRTKDEVVQAVWPSETLAPGKSRLRVLEYEVVKA